MLKLKFSTVLTDLANSDTLIGDKEIKVNNPIDAKCVCSIITQIYDLILSRCLTDFKKTLHVN